MEYSAAVVELLFTVAVDIGSVSWIIDSGQLTSHMQHTLSSVCLPLPITKSYVQVHGAGCQAGVSEASRCVIH